MKQTMKKSKTSLKEERTTVKLTCQHVYGCVRVHNKVVAKLMQYGRRATCRASAQRRSVCGSELGQKS